jgi:hypothetical protein
MKKQQLNFVERGNGFPPVGTILVCHEDCTAYRVLPSRTGTGEGGIVTRQWHSNECLLHVRALKYDTHCNDDDAWDI